MASNSKRTGKGHGLRYTSYKNSGRIATNRRRRLVRALKRNPENTQISVALSAGLGQRRQTPKVEAWSHTAIRMAHLFKQLQGSFNMDILSRNEKLSAPALMDAGKLGMPVPTKGGQLVVKRAPKVDEKAMFQLGSRV